MITAPLLIMTIFATMEFSMILLVNASLKGSQRDAARFGTTGTNATLSNPTLVTSTTGIVIGETVFEYKPWFIKMIPSSTIHHIAVFRPRLSNEVTCTDCGTGCTG